MEIRKGERWRCQNPACQSEISVIASSEVVNGKNPRCSCGNPMKKPYVRPEMKMVPSTEESRHNFGPHATLCPDLYPAKRTPQGSA
jgi:hypothetical protein